MSAKKSRVSIKPSSSYVQMDPNYAENTWNLLKNAIHEIQRKNASGLSFEELYRNAYNMILHKYGDKLYEGLRSVVQQQLRESSEKIINCNEEKFLEVLNEVWTDHKMSMLMIRDILMYMDRVYVVQNNVAPIYDLGLQLFYNEIARHPRIKERILRHLLGNIQRERQGEVVNRGLLKNIIQMLVDLGIKNRTVYEEEFEKPFLEMSTQFYQAESVQFMSENNCSEYLKKIERRIREEMDRVRHYLDPQTEPKIKEVVERELIWRHMKSLVEMEGSGEVSMLKDDKYEDLARMYNLLGRVAGGHDLMKSTLFNFLREIGKATVEAPENADKPNSYVQALLTLKDKYDAILIRAFGNDKSFQHTVNQAFEYFINLNPKSPEYISLFIDEKLRKGAKGGSEDEIERILDKVMTLFRFIQEKDVFERYYKQHLAKRLLLGRSVSDDAERSMISKLKAECGYQFTSKLEGMFTDMKLSIETMENFRNQIADTNVLGGIELNVYVLTTGFWPTQTVSTCILPPEINKCCEVFTKYYLSNHSGRRLTWQTNMGTADLRAYFGTKRHELCVTTYQMCILLLFNTQNTLSFKDIHTATAIPIPDLKRSLAGLTSPKCKILIKEPNTKFVEETDTFTFNDKFRSKLVKVKVPAAAQKETDKERNVTKERVEEDRKILIDAAIVRIMKARKSMEHNNLVAEVTKQLSSRFPPNPIVIKKRIESLIEREYLERSQTNRKMYSYLA
jgi:cullin 3